MKRFLVIMAVVVSSVFSSGCGTVIVGTIYALLEGGRTKKVRGALPPGAPSIVLQSVVGTQSAYVVLKFTLLDSDEDNVDV
ncbi:MAG: hypothetical protein N2234_10365, partial [Planctomycetota bacterium]|nr:hypothetical protein [Planctomycetota bacterium]